MGPVVFLHRLMLYTRLASPIAVCIAIQCRYTRLAWLANPNPNATNPSRVYRHFLLHTPIQMSRLHAATAFYSCYVVNLTCSHANKTAVLHYRICVRLNIVTSNIITKSSSTRYIQFSIQATVNKPDSFFSSMTVPTGS